MNEIKFISKIPTNFINFSLISCLKSFLKHISATFSIFVFSKMHLTFWLLTLTTINVFHNYFFSGYRMKFRNSRFLKLGLKNLAKFLYKFRKKAESLKKSAEFLPVFPKEIIQDFFGSQSYKPKCKAHSRKCAFYMILN